jgi:hypothetical protein
LLHLLLLVRSGFAKQVFHQQVIVNMVEFGVQGLQF